mgnify:CR=1 FL=1
MTSFLILDYVWIRFDKAKGGDITYGFDRLPSNADFRIRTAVSLRYGFSLLLRIPFEETAIRQYEFGMYSLL